jgi:very-short-patch-repair endonuclease
LYKALKSLGVSFAPLAVFIRGGQTYRRIEPDFIIIRSGIVMIVEVDGDTVHLETPAEAHARTTMLVHEGAHLERVKSSECDTPVKALAYANSIIQLFSTLKASR